MKVFNNILGHTIFITDKTVEDYENIYKMPLDEDMIMICTEIAEETNPTEIDDIELSNIIENNIKKDFDDVYLVPPEFQYSSCEEIINYINEIIKRRKS